MRSLKASFAFHVAIALSTVVLRSGPALAADEAHTLSFRLDWMASALHSPFYLAAEKGWFKKAGLDVSIVLGNGSVTTVQLVDAGQYDVGHASLAVMAMGRGKGMSVTSIACFTRSSLWPMVLEMIEITSGASAFKCSRPSGPVTASW